jgi:ABC-2 type transport system permease protein
VLSTAVSRTRWALSSGLGVFAAIGLTTLVLAGVVAIAIATQGGSIVEPMLGVGVLGLATAAYTGLGLAVGGLVRASLAAPVAAGLVIATFLLDTLGEALDLPDAVLDLSLYRHLGQPMAGIFDWSGIVAAAVLAIGGLLVGTWGLRRRDLER